jgi:hypothetical protein
MWCYFLSSHLLNDPRPTVAGKLEPYFARFLSVLIVVQAMMLLGLFSRTFLLPLAHYSSLSACSPGLLSADPVTRA